MLFDAQNPSNVSAEGDEVGGGGDGDALGVNTSLT